MKTLHATLLALAITAITCSCKKQDLQTKKEPVLETGAVEAFMKEKKEQIGSSGLGWELGVTFFSSVKGQIKSFKLHLPTTGQYLVTLWKASDQSIVTAETLYISNTASWNEQPIDPVTIEKNTEYILSVNAKSCYYYNFSSQLLPYTNQHITLTHYCFAFGTGQSYPGIPYPDGAAGFADISFLPTE